MIKIPEQYYVGIRPKPGNKDIPLAFATPFGTDSAFNKRKTTVDKWTGPVCRGSRFETYDNVLLEGFRISQSVRRYGWNGGNVVWRIEDPRGFELEISSSNFASIVDCCVIDKGVIAGKCIWGRDGATNILLPEGSDPYQEAINFTKLSKKDVAVADLEIGQFVRMKDDTVAVYCGVYHGFGLEVNMTGHYGHVSFNYGRDMSYTYEITPRLLPKRHVFLQEKFAREYAAGRGISESGLYGTSDVKGVAEILVEKMGVDVNVVKGAIVNLKRDGYSCCVFTRHPSAVDEKPFKKVEFKVVDGATPGSIEVYEDPRGQLHFIGYNNFHQEYSGHYTPPKPDRELFVNLCPLNIGELAIKRTFSKKTPQIRNATTDYFKDWKPKTLIAVLDGRMEVPVTIPRYRHEAGRPMTETSAVKRS